MNFIGLLLSFIGAISSAWFIFEKLSKHRKLTWKFAEKAVMKITDQMLGDNFSPSLIVGIGRGGAIMGALISGALGHRPLIVIDRKYTWENGRRVDDMIDRLQINFDLEKVLLVAGEVHSGNTMRLYYDYFKNLGAKEVRRCVLFFEKGSVEPVEYKGLISLNKELRLPWMFNKRYRREDRSVEESRGLG